MEQVQSDGIPVDFEMVDGSTPVIESNNEGHLCGRCDKVFKTASKLRVHNLNEHFTHRCEACKKRFSSGHLLDRHCQSVHGFRSYVL